MEFRMTCVNEVTAHRFDGPPLNNHGLQTCERPPLWALVWPRGGVHMFTTLPHLRFRVRVANRPRSRVPFTALLTSGPQTQASLFVVFRFGRSKTFSLKYL